MEIKSNINKLDPYLNRTDLEQVNLKAEARAGMKVNVSSPAQDSGDKVSLSTAALKNVVAEEAAKAPDIRQDRVDAVKASLNSGTYDIDSENIAAKLLGF